LGLRSRRFGSRFLSGSFCSSRLGFRLGLATTGALGLFLGRLFLGSLSRCLRLGGFSSGFFLHLGGSFGGLFSRRFACFFLVAIGILRPLATAPATAAAAALSGLFVGRRLVARFFGTVAVTVGGIFRCVLGIVVALALAIVVLTSP